MPYRRACSADARPVRPAEGKCHAQECKAQGSAQSKALWPCAFCEGTMRFCVEINPMEPQNFRAPPAINQLLGDAPLPLEIGCPWFQLPPYFPFPYSKAPPMYIPGHARRRQCMCTGTASKCALGHIPVC